MDVGNGQAQAQRRGSMYAVLGRLLPAVPRALLEPEARVDLLLAAERLPNALSRRNVGLELRLQGPPRGDLFVAARPTASDGLILHDWLVDFPGGAAGARLSLVLSRWQQGLGWFARSCRFVLLEVDASQRVGDSLPPPAVFLIPQAGGDVDADVAAARNAFQRDPEGLVAALAELDGCRPDPAVATELRKLLDLLPQRAELFAAGVMLSRPTSSAPRIAVRGVRASELDGLLSGLGRFGAATQLAPLASRLEPHLVDLAVALDLGPLGSDAVGLELYAGDPSGWNGLLDALVLLGLADRDRVDAAEAVARSGPMNGADVRLNHVKLTAVHDRLAPTKLYVVMHPPAPLSLV
jgi:hypothetical protein